MKELTLTELELVAGGVGTEFIPSTWDNGDQGDWGDFGDYFGGGDGGGGGGSPPPDTPPDTHPGVPSDLYA